jgi:hypothetical protein
MLQAKIMQAGKNVVKFNEMNAQTNSSYQNDTFVVVVRARIKDLTTILLVER